MFVFNVVLISFAISSAVCSVVTRLASNSPCRSNEFLCGDGSCISVESVCDGHSDCTDGSDEFTCHSSTKSNVTESTGSHWRAKRQTICSRQGQWPCADGTCIPVGSECDGKYDCRDMSDESHANCRKMTCPGYLFQCTYGACVDSTAPCNNITNCVDGSDELLARCRKQKTSNDGKFRCDDGNAIPSWDACDGKEHCLDGSDETVAACAEHPCDSYLFRCKYGACVDKGSDCNGIKECADGSDETDELCNRTPSNNNFIDNSFGSNVLSRPDNCPTPQDPDHGKYVVVRRGHSTNQPIVLNVTCDPGYRAVNESVIYCIEGQWTWTTKPECIRHCRLDVDISVEYICLSSGRAEYSRPCNKYEPEGTYVKSRCMNNYFSDDLPYMHCEINGKWNRIVKCRPDCGIVTPTGDNLIAGGRTAKRGELPWYVAVYRKMTPSPHKHICGGTLVSKSVVISAGHCFWDSTGKQNASLYAVATAKMYIEWDNENDTDAQKSDLKDIHVPQKYQGSLANQQSDIAILILKNPFEYREYVKPVCLDFEEDFNKRQLSDQNLGKIAGFGLTEANGGPSQVLKVVELPFVDYVNCKNVTPYDFIPKLTFDKICAGYSNGTAALCMGDSGGGLAFPDLQRGITRYYLRGIVSTAPQSNNNDKCNINTVITFTSVIDHVGFIKIYL